MIHAQPGGTVRQPEAPDAPPATSPAAGDQPADDQESRSKARYPDQAIKDKVRDPVEVVLVLELDASRR